MKKSSKILSANAFFDINRWLVEKSVHTSQYKPMLYTAKLGDTKYVI